MVAGALAWPTRLVNTGHTVVLAAVERRIPFWPMERIERLQRRRLRSIVRHAYETVPYYRRTMDELGLRPRDFETVADIAKLPLLDDALVREDPEQFASTRYDDRTRRTSFTSGSRSRIRKRIYWDYASVPHRRAYSERDRAVVVKMLGKDWGRRQLYVFPPTGNVSISMASAGARLWVPTRVARCHRFPAEEPFAALVAKLNAFRPDVVFSYGSYAEQFFRFLVDSGTTPALPRVWRYAGDMLSPGGKELIEGRFGCMVYSTYQSVETARIGFQCERRQGFHLNIDLCPIRVVDAAGREIPPGEDGEIVVSNLHNRAMVLLNYRLGDWGALATGPCPCGRSLPLLERLDGRRSEAISLADGRVLSSLVVGSLFPRQLVSALKAQVVQPTPGTVRWRIVPFGGVDREAMRSAILARGRDVLGEGTRVEVEFVADIPPAPSGKFSLVAQAEESV